MRKLSGAIAVGLIGSAFLLSAPAASAQDGAALFASTCSGCHNDVEHPRGLVYNAAGNVAIIEAVNALGMGAVGSLADHTSIAAYLDSVKPTINMAPVAHDSPGTVINLRDIIVSASETHADWQMIAKIVTVSSPAKGTVSYRVANGFARPSFVTYTPFPGQSGTDTWTYQGIGPGGTTTIRTASVKIADADGAPDLNRHGLTGSWFEPATTGQGIELEFYPDFVAPGTAFVAGAWFTFDSAAIGGADRERWYTFQGNGQTGQPSVAVTLLQNVGGNFNAPPITNSTVVGSGTLAFTTCDAGTFQYVFTDGSGRAGMIPLTRIAQNVTCTTGTTPTANPDYALSGNWYDAATSGQGFLFEVNPVARALFFTWYTYAPNGQAAGASGQRWFIGFAPYAPGSRSVDVTLGETTGGLFDQVTNPAPVTASVGTGRVTFASCTSAQLNFNFTGGSMAGHGGTISLVRVGPVPPGCGP